MLKVAGLHLWRGDRHVLRGVSFEGAAGRCVLLTGRNGAGKTSLIRVIAGLLEAEEGEVSWRGRSTRGHRHDFHSELSYLGHEPPLKGDLNARENLRFLVGIRRVTTPAEIDSALARTGATPFADRPVRMLSAGQKRRVALAGVVLSQTVLWLLDEPTTNLDVDGQQLVSDLIEEQLSREGVVVAAVHHAMPLPESRVLPLELSAS